MNLELLTKIANEFKIIILKYSLTIKDNLALKLLGGKNTINNVDIFVYNYDYIYFCNNKEINIIYEKSKIISERHTVGGTSPYLSHSFIWWQS
jgi:hypothetical protein